MVLAQKPGNSEISALFLGLAAPVTLLCLFQFSKKILTLGLNQDPPPHPNTVRLQRMVRYSATLFVQVKPSCGGRNSSLASPAFLPLRRQTMPIICSLFVHLLLFKIVNIVMPHLEKNLDYREK